MPARVKVALARAKSYNDPELDGIVAGVLKSAGIAPQGRKILVKPNLLMAHALSCTSPAVTAAACKWLLHNGAQITVADSPAFGTAANVAAKTGLSAALKPLGLAVRNFSLPRRILLYPCGSEPVPAFMAPEALECDAILSIPRVKAHSQMRITLAVKNCFGCMCGIHKALAHAPRDLTLEVFADRIAALWAALPPVMGLADGIVAMTGTGPRNGAPLELGFIGASTSAPALDLAILELLGLNPCEIPLSMALRRRAQAGDARAEPVPDFTMLKPADLATTKFSVPQKLKAVSFNPAVLAKSLLRRIWKGLGR